MTEVQPPRTFEFRTSDTFITDLGMRADLSEDGARMEGLAGAGTFVRAPGGTMRPSVLATVADVLAGIPACRATAPQLALTLDISVHTVAPPTSDEVRAEARILKVGRGTVSTAVDFFDAVDGSPVALCHLTFVPSPRPQDVAPMQFTGVHTAGSMPVPFPDHVGARVVAPGVAEIDHRPFVTQASGTLQGGTVALLGELAAESLTGRPVLDLDTRYLKTVRVGPGRAVAVRWAPDLVRVEVRDAGNPEALAAVITARTTPGEPGGDGAV